MIFVSKKYRIYFLISLVLFLAGCVSLRKTGESARPLVLYNPGKTVLHPQFSVYHHSPSESMVFFKVLASEVIFNQANPTVQNQARLRMFYTLYSSFENKEVAARDTQSFVINRETVGDAIIASMKIPTELGKTYILDVTLEDEIRLTGFRDLIMVDRFSEDTRQNWLVLNQPGNHVAFESFYYPGESFRLIREQGSGAMVYISVFSPRKVLPLPPFSLEEEPDDPPLPDSTFVKPYSEQMTYTLGGEGVYIFHTQRERIKGLCLTQFGERYPQISLPEDMLPPLQ